MIFKNSIILYSLPLVFMPLLIHLINRMRYHKIDWAAVMFIQNATRKSGKMVEIKQWLILAARIFAICALIFALARPLIGGWFGKSFSTTPSTILLIPDQSATMSSEEKNGRTKLNNSLETLIRNVESLGGNTSFAAVDSVNGEIKEIPSAEYIRKISIGQKSSASSDFPYIFKKVSSYLKNQKTGNSEIWIASDLQRSNWRPQSSQWKEINFPPKY